MKVWILIVVLVVTSCSCTKGKTKRKSVETSNDNDSFSQVGQFFLILLCTIIMLLLWQIGVTPNDVIRGVPFHKNLTQIKWPDDLEVSNTKTVNVSFRTFNRIPLKNPLANGALTVEVYCEDNTVPMSTIIESENGEDVSIVFNATRSGVYIIILKSHFQIVRGFPTSRRIVAGDVDPSKTLFQRLRSHTMILTAGNPEDLRLNPNDKFGNPIEISKLSTLTSRISFQLWHVDASGGGQKLEVSTGQNFIVYLSESGTSLCISIAFASGEEGWKEASIQLDGEPIREGNLTLIVLSRNEKTKVDHIVRGRKGREFYSGELDYFEADLLGTHGQRLEKPKKVYCYLTDKQLSIREYFLKIFLKRTFSYRLVPATKLTLVRYLANAPVIRIEDGFQRQGRGPEVCLHNGLLLVACFHRILLDKMGGSETFEDKKTFFYNKLVAYHLKKSHKHVPHSLRISRYPSILKSSIAATKSMSDYDWAKLFIIEFEGECGIDHGGIRREWFSLLAKELFSSENKLFVQVEEGGPAMMPNPHYDGKTMRQMYRFAGKIVGKCLYESAHGTPYSQFLPLRLAKSFLAQLVGLRVNFRHFANDAPEFYASKISLIESCDVDDPNSGLDDLTFSEEVHHNISTIVDLKPQGRNIRVTDDDKMEYLDLLAQYRLSECIREQVDLFLEGLHTFVPDSLLSMFDEAELELLLCGVRDYNLSDLKKHHTVVIDGISSRLIGWFWLALSHFTSEQFARLLQFTTGSSQLPPGGFKELKPLFQIASAHKPNGLPTAHTCFNMICLPEHAKFDDFEKALLTAITDGAEGFQLI